LKDYTTCLIQELKQEQHAKDRLQVNKIEEQYRSEVKLPVDKLSQEVEHIKRS
jgi:hypothetical protein